jgi:uncharacterized protein YijF (DUF1287 family)
MKHLRFLLFLLVFPSLAFAQSSALLIKAARKQIGVTTSYDPAYVSLAYPNGDLPIERGVCTDVVIRAMRQNGIDLQKEVHEDMKRAFAVYPKTWGLKTTDKNIDHRRVPNLQKYFERKNFKRPLPDTAEAFQPGDLVTCLVAGKLPHIMIVSDQKGASGHWKVIHNIGAGTQEEDCLMSHKLTGHYRWKW